MLDASAIVAWVEQEQGRVEALFPHLAANEVSTTRLCLAEAARVLLRSGRDRTDFEPLLATWLGLDPVAVAQHIDAAELVDRVRRERRDSKLSLADALVYVESRHRGEPLLTFDRDFEGLDGAIVLQ